MNSDSKNKFIAKTAAQIYAAMFANPEKDPDMNRAIQGAEDLWDELVEQQIITPKD